MKEETVVRQNLMDSRNYSPYCGNDDNKKCNSTPRTIWSPSFSQFYCPLCGWVSQFPDDFISRYKSKHNL